MRKKSDAHISAKNACLQFLKIVQRLGLTDSGFVNLPV